MIEPRAVAIVRVALDALEHDDPAAHRLLSSLVADLDVPALCQVVETLVIATVDLTDRLQAADLAFNPDRWVEGLGLIAAGA